MTSQSTEQHNLSNTFAGTLCQSQEHYAIDCEGVNLQDWHFPCFSPTAFGKESGKMLCDTSLKNRQLLNKIYSATPLTTLQKKTNLYLKGGLFQLKLVSIEQPVDTSSRHSEISHCCNCCRSLRKTPKDYMFGGSLMVWGVGIMVGGNAWMIWVPDGRRGSGVFVWWWWQVDVRGWSRAG